MGSCFSGSERDLQRLIARLKDFAERNPAEQGRLRVQISKHEAELERRQREEKQSKDWLAQVGRLASPLPLFTFTG